MPVWSNRQSGFGQHLRTFDLRKVAGDMMSVTRLPGPSELAHLLREILLRDAFPNPSDPPPERVVSLHHLEFLTIVAQPVHSILLNHILFPIDLSLSQSFDFSDGKTPIPTYIPGIFKNVGNIPPITSLNLSFDPGMFLRIDGPGLSHHMFGSWDGADPSPSIVDARVLRSINPFLRLWSTSPHYR